MPAPLNTATRRARRNASTTGVSVSCHGSRARPFMLMHSLTQIAKAPRFAP